MIDSEVLERQFGVSPDELWQRLSKALTLVPGATLTVIDEQKREARFVTGVSSWSWGENMIATVARGNDGGALLHITGQVRHTFLSSSFGEALHRRGFTKNLLRQIGI